MWQGGVNPGPIMNQPQAYPQGPYSQGPPQGFGGPPGPFQGPPQGAFGGQPGPYQGMPIDQQFSGGGYTQGGYYGPNGPQQGFPPHQQGYGQMGIPMQQMGGGGEGGMMKKVMGVLNEVVDVDPMKGMHSSGNILTGPSAPFLLPMGPQEGCPIGLEFLLGTDHLLVKQQVEKMEALLAQVGIGVETPNRYDVFNSSGQRIYFAAEMGGLVGMQFSPSGPTRPFKIMVVDFAGRTILHIERPWNCKFCCLSCCNFCGTTGTKVTVRLGDGTLLGEVTQKFNWCKPKFLVKDDADNVVGNIVGPGCTDCCCTCPGSCGCDVNFNIQNPDGTTIGEITKKWSGMLREGFTDADTFGVSFPHDLNVRAKAMLLGAVFLIDFMFFEQHPNENR